MLVQPMLLMRPVCTFLTQQWVEGYHVSFLAGMRLSVRGLGAQPGRPAGTAGFGRGLGCGSHLCALSWPAPRLAADCRALPEL